MSVTITHSLEKTIGTDGPFIVTDTVIGSLNIQQEVFVFEVDTDEYNHVATAADMQLYPNSKAAAVTANLGYYRAATVTASFPSTLQANAFADVLEERLKLLCVDYDTLLTNYTASVTETVIS